MLERMRHLCANSPLLDTLSPARPIRPVAGIGNDREFNDVLGDCCGLWSIESLGCRSPSASVHG